MNDDLSDAMVQAVAGALESGHKIEAIKIYREATGKGLTEAKAFMDALIPKLIEQDPDKYAHLAQKDVKGCGTAMLILLAVGVAIGTLFF